MSTSEEPIEHTGDPALETPNQTVGERSVNQALRIIAIVSFVLNVVSNVRYNFGRRSPWDNGHQDDVGFTPFTAFGPAIVLYWIVGVAGQLTFLARFFDATPRLFIWQFIFSNVLTLSWSYWFARSHYFLSELTIILNFLQLLGGYILGASIRLRPLSHWLAVHGAVFVFPLVWSHYLIFWNGAVMFGARDLPSRLIANIVIWEFLFVPALLMLMFGDYLFGLSSAWIAFALGVGQLLTKVFALQWAFAFTIGTILLLSSLVLAFVSPSKSISPPLLVEVREAVTNTDENAPLLTDP